MRVAGLILHWEETDLTDATLAAMRRQMLDPWDTLEPWVIDNGSEDFPWVGDAYKLRFEQNLLFVGGWNRAMQAMEMRNPPFDALWMCNNDIGLPDPHTLASLIEVLDKQPRVAVVSPSIKDNCHLQMLYGDDREVGNVYWVDWVAPLVRALAWQDVGPFEPRLKGDGADVSWCYRARERGWLCAVDRRVQITHLAGETRRRQHGNGIAHWPLIEEVMTEKWGADWKEKMMSRKEAGPPLCV